MRLTEGEIKSHVAYQLSGVPTVGFAGCSSWGAIWKTVKPAVEALQPKTLLLSFDSDHRDNQDVARCMVEAFEHLTAEGFDVAVEVWPAESGKGCDDALLAGEKLEVLYAANAATYIREVAQKAGVNLSAEDPISAVVNYADDDPSRLARLNIERYRRLVGGEIKYWHGAWYTWTKARGCWREIDEGNLRGKLWEAVNEEFERLNCAAIESGEGDERRPPIKRRVSASLITNVVGGTLGIKSVRGSSTDTLGSWIGGDRTRHRNFIAMSNGLLDLEAVLAGKDQSAWLLPHTPAWFSTVRLPYPVDENATCPKWIAFLNRSLEGDAERIAILQEWAGYLLVSDTSQQRFLVLIGEGANGKSVYCGGMSAMLGGDANCSFVPLEMLGTRFGATPTLGKLVNICADANEIDRTAEGFIKSFTSGDAYTFDRKGKDAFSATPTARLMIACNAHPKFHDRTDGMSRREILMPFRVQIPRRDRIIGMDKPAWWESSGELPGIFWWAIGGLGRLRSRREFTRSKVCDDATDELRWELNPAKEFLRDHIEVDRAAALMSRVLYGAYVHWCSDNGCRPLGNKQFGKEMARVFPTANRRQFGSGKSKKWGFEGVDFSVDEVAGKAVSEFEPDRTWA